MTDSLGEMKSNQIKSNQIKPIDRVIKPTFSEKGGAAAVRLPPAKRNEWKWTADVLHQTSHEIMNVERIGIQILIHQWNNLSSMMKSNQSNEWYIILKHSLEDDEIKPIDRGIKPTFSEKGGAAALRLPPAKRKEWRWTADVLHQTSHEIMNVERIRYTIIKQYLEDMKSTHE